MYNIHYIIYIYIILEYIGQSRSYKLWLRSTWVSGSTARRPQRTKDTEEGTLYHFPVGRWLCPTITSIWLKQNLRLEGFPVGRNCRHVPLASVAYPHFACGGVCGPWTRQGGEVLCSQPMEVCCNDRRRLHALCAGRFAFHGRERSSRSLGGSRITGHEGLGVD